MAEYFLKQNVRSLFAHRGIYGAEGDPVIPVSKGDVWIVERPADKFRFPVRQELIGERDAAPGSVPADPLATQDLPSPGPELPVAKAGGPSRKPSAKKAGKNGKKELPPAPGLFQ